MVRWAVGLRPAGVDVRLSRLELGERLCEAVGAVLVAVVDQDALESPAEAGEIGCDAAGEAAGVLDGGLGDLGDDQVGPAVGAVGVDGGDLPDRALRASEPPDEEAVHADQLTRPCRLDVRLGHGRTLRLGRRGVAGDEAEPLRARVEPMALEDAQTVLCEMRTPPQHSRASSLLIRFGP